MDKKYEIYKKLIKEIWKKKQELIKLENEKALLWHELNLRGYKLD